MKKIAEENEMTVLLPKSPFREKSMGHHVNGIRIDEDSNIFIDPIMFVDNPDRLVAEQYEEIEDLL